MRSADLDAVMVIEQVSFPEPWPRRFFEQDRDLPHTMVIFESPVRVGKTLGIALEVLGNRDAAVCIELTKKFERVERGRLPSWQRHSPTGR